MHPSGVITITTDFGHKGPFSAVMKGVIAGRFPDANVIDLSHDIPAQWPPEAGFWVSRAYRYFPKGTVHIAIVDPGVGTERKILLAIADGHCFMAPDNGLLGRLLEDVDDAIAWHLDDSKLDSLGLETPSATFHGRDIFAPIAAEIAAGRISVDEIATQTQDWTPGWLDEPEVLPGKISGTIVTVDTFGNLISNIDGTLVQGFKAPVVHIAGRHIGMLQTYGRAEPGAYLALENSFGVIEVARAEGNAAEALGSDRGAPITITDGLSV